MKNSPKTPSTSAPYVNTPTMNRARLTGPVVGLTLLTLGLVACGGSTPSIPASVTPAASAGGKGDVVASRNPDTLLVPFSYDGTNHDWSDPASALTIQGLNLSSGNNDLSAQAWSNASSGWGPVEKNRSNGEYNGGDGNTLTLQGKTYTTGLGVHASSDITYDVNGQCSGFQSDMGVDDEVRSLGSVTFEIWADGTRLYDSGVMTGNSATKFASVDLTGKNQLRLVVTGGGDNINYDHADWAGAILLGCSGSNTTWTTVASEYGSFTLQARSTVRYGTGQSWTQKDLDAGTYACSNDTFGTDPAYGFFKQCQVSSVSASAGSSRSITAYSGPLVITKGGTYSGNWESQDPNVPVISVQTNEPVIIENSNLRGKGNLITGFGNRLTVRNVNGYGLNPNVYGRSVGKFVNAEDFISIRIENIYAENTTGTYFRNYTGNPSSGDTVKMFNSRFININGLSSNGSNGYIMDAPDGRAHMIQFNAVRRIPNVEIAWNEVINEPGKSQVEENINFYESSGTPSSPMLIHDNYIQGAYATRPNGTSGYAGGGILAGDGIVSNPLDSGYSNVYNNQIVSTTNQGLAIAGGVYNRFYNNRVIASGLLSDGSRISAQNVGIYMWDINNAGSYSTPTFGNNSMENNFVAWTRINPDGSTYTNPWWFPDCGTKSSTCAGNVSGGKATLDTEKQEYQLWLNKLSTNGVKVGTSN